MKNYLVAERYAKALNASISADAEVEGAVAGLQELADLYSETHDIRSVLANPTIDVDRRAEVLKEVLTKQETPSVVGRLADVLLRRGRIALLPDVAEVFSALADERLNRVGATVTTAVGLSAEQEARLRQTLEKYSGKTIRMTSKVDPDVLGGVVARLGSIVIDGSVRTQLKRLRDALLSEET